MPCKEKNPTCIYMCFRSAESCHLGRNSCDINWTLLCPSPLQIIKWFFHGSVQLFSLKMRKNAHQISHDLGNSKVFHRFQPAGLKVLLLHFFCDQDSNENKQPKYLQVVYQKCSISQPIAPAPAEPVGGQLIVNTCNYLIV